jgi:uncharacterized protein YdhG (YjbR/CyaY superfamily)
MSDKLASVDAYIAALPPQAQAIAHRLRALVHAAAPGATEAVRYGMPAFQANGVTFLHLGVWKRHAGFYPVYCGDAAFEAAVRPFRSGKDTVRFDLAGEPPADLVTRIVQAQASRAAQP